ncbi:related to tol protein [Fusarium fujikuroi]|nr:related to tol protein [Fusarium fujikuroi]
MAYSTLCPTCTRALHFDQASWEEERRNSSMWPLRRHHDSLGSFRKAASQNCYICCRVWDMLISGKATSAEREPTWKEGSETDWDGMHYVVQHDHDSPAILLMICCPGSKQHSHYIPFELMPRNGEWCFLFFKPVHIERKLTSVEDNYWIRYDARPSLSSSTSSPSTLRLISKWIQSCQKGHKSSICTKDVTPWQPTRLLDIGRSKDETCRIVLRPQNITQTRTYITLSYRWDAKKQPRLLSSNIDELLRGWAIRTLPKTFRDTIVVARALGVRHLWIDALCIIQDSHEDWERESACMGLVYSNGLCNIAASASDGPDGGLFRSRNAESIRLGCVRANPLPETRSQTFNIIDTLYTHRQLRYTPFFKRGWVFQERMLAPRVIYFAEEQVFWECHQELKCEAFPTGIPFAGSFKALLPERLTTLSAWSRGKCVPCTMFRQWNRAVQDYSDSQFTFISDKLPAFMGIASYFEPFMDTDYAFGMWNVGLERQLGFSVEYPVVKQSKDYRAPSWSWASLDGPVLYTYLLSGENPKTFMHIQFEEDGFLQGQLHLQGVLTHATYSHATSRRKSNVVLEDGTSLDLILLKDHLGVVFSKGTKLTLLAFESSRDPSPFLDCVVLEPILCTWPVTNYRRIGFAHVFQKEEFNSELLEPEKFRSLGVTFTDSSASTEASRLSSLIMI